MLQGGGRCVPELILHTAQTEAGLDQMGRIAVTQRVDGHVLADARIGDGQLERPLHGRTVHEMACGYRRGAGLSGKQPARVTMFRPPATQGLECDRRQDHEAVLVAFGKPDMDVHPGAVDVGDLKLQSLAEP